MAKRSTSTTAPKKAPVAAAPVSVAAPVAPKIAAPVIARTPIAAAPAKGNGGNGKSHIPTDAIAKRAYEIWKSGKGGSDIDNWIRAENELKAAAAATSR